MPTGVSIHAPRAGRDVGLMPSSAAILRFNPRAPCGARRIRPAICRSSASFNPRAPCGARHVTGVLRAIVEKFQSTRPVRGATLGFHCTPQQQGVSIHAPRAGRDVISTTDSSIPRCFNPRAPCGARPHPLQGCFAYSSFNPRAPCGARRTAIISLSVGKGFNPRAPCGARRLRFSMQCPISTFQSTRPVRGATAKKVTTSLFCHIFMGLTRHEYGLLGAYVPHPSFDVVHAPIFLHFIFCLLHLRTPKST